LAGIGNLRFKVSQTLPRPFEEQVQITDLIGECRKTGLSRRAYAALRGVHESAVRKAIASGRITTEADGTIDAAMADAMWDASTDPAKQRGAHARDLGRGTAAATRAVAGTKAVLWDQTASLAFLSPSATRSGRLRIPAFAGKQGREGLVGGS